MLPATVIFKIKPAYRLYCDAHDIHLPAFVALKNRIQPVSIRKMHPHHRAPQSTVDEFGQSLSDLSLIYVLNYESNLPVLRIVNELSGSGWVEYAQPWFIDQPLTDLQTQLTPNDTSIHLQWYLSKIGTLQVWDSTQGDTNVVIGIVDGGTNFTHPDLMANVYYNWADPINGLDDDNDGYIDNFRGWDVGDKDNNPQYVGVFNSAHGTSMCGIAAASTHNTTAMAGVGFNSRYMPVKMVHSTQGWIAGYPGIVYAADHGAHIISCSWGGTTPGPYGQDVIRYAAVNKQKIIFAAAGNSNNTVPFYPASYEYVIAVGGTEQNDYKSANSSYYPFVDIASPGQSIFNTYATGWGWGNGTSDATALASGSAALIQSFFDTLVPWQIGSLLQQTAYLIDTIPANAPYINQLGYGRIDVWRAITQSPRAFIHMNNRHYTDNFDDLFFSGDTVQLSGSFINTLAGSSPNLYARLISQTPYVTIIDSIIQLGVLPALQSVVPAASFSFAIHPSCPVNHLATFLIEYDDNGFLNRQYLTVFLNPTFYSSLQHGLVTTLTSTGRIGFNSNNSGQGSGYRLKQEPNQLLQLYFNPMGFWIGAENNVSNQTLTDPLGACCPFNNDSHFVATQPLHRILPPVIAQAEYKRTYTDANAGIAQQYISITQTDYFYHNNYFDSLRIFLRYEMHNQGTLGKKNLFAGIFSDFDVLDSILGFSPNIAYFDTLRQLGVVYNPIGNTWCGIQLLSQKPVSYFANNSDGSNGSINIYNGFSQSEKFSMISNGIARPISDLTDVSQFIGCRIDTLPPQTCDVVWFALLIAKSQSELISLAGDTWTTHHSRFNTWTGNHNQDWHHPLNWSSGQIPNASDYVIIPWVNTFTPIISNADASARDVEILCGGTLQIINGRKLQIGN